MTEASANRLRVFLCHSSGDKPVVHKLYKRLVADGIDAWLDKEKLLPGQDWKQEIPRAVREADIVLICLTKNSVNKTGYVQKEMKFALDVAEEQPSGAIFLIPVRLEECDVPDSLSKYHWADLFWDGKNFDNAGYDQLMKSLRLRAGVKARTLQPDPPPLVVEPERILPEIHVVDPQPQPINLPPWHFPRISIQVILAVFLIGLLSTGIFFRSAIGATLFPSQMPTSTNSPEPTARQTLSIPPQCAYKRDTDDATIKALINAEADAASSKNMDVLSIIFSEKALFSDYGGDILKQATGPVAHYEENLFVNYELKDVRHFDIMPAVPARNGDLAYYTSGSGGYYRTLKPALKDWLSLSKGSIKTTKYGSDQWTLQKDSFGCWIIVKFNFNAGDHPFPP